MKTKTEPAAPAAPAIPFTACTACRYCWRGQCRLHPPNQTGGWAAYPNVANDSNHGCFQGKNK